ncbi:PREDICTED: uncharacterized protein LOC106309181 [Brassica oleracea var. oleracea]|uniref:uncharacterized protein LOC106309181 n=1 Tax=Brassica oleracea var. oleracea TaxID=109376 RepID=UPI0006A6FB02|nr:PREDICTED: uncharacterized protein LOC106309181 [Brassica oleracea var. oleracea]
MDFENPSFSLRLPGSSCIAAGYLSSKRIPPHGSLMLVSEEAAFAYDVAARSIRRLTMPQHAELNSDMMLDALDALEERRDQALLRIQNYQHMIKGYYNKKVRARPLELGDQVLRKVFENTKEWGTGKLGTKWEWPYKIVEVIQPGVYRLKTSSGEPDKRAWNSMNLRLYRS